MGQCVSSGSAKANSSGNLDKPNSRCQAPGCQKACDPGSRSRYCAQHAVCRRQGCARPRGRKGPYCQEHLHTCRVSRCSNDQVRVYDARFTNRLCWDHQPAEDREAWFAGTLFAEYGTAGANTTDYQQQRTRRRRSRQKPNPRVEVAPAPVYEPPVYTSQASSSDSDDDNARDVAHQLSTIGEEAEVTSPPTRGPQAPHPETAPGTPTARRSQKTVHFAESPPRTSSPEKHEAVAADIWAAADPERSASATALRSSRHRRSVDGRHGTRSSPKTSGSAVAPVTHNREKRRSTGSVPSKSADAKRAPRSRSRP
ncbi:hypothetical protein LZ32DRAFT_167444 [Colletotrichum eremochloae]|nr:hypothetical protein LZ32DRAFT_167444 [Colletotrichum eremochloae]